MILFFEFVLEWSRGAMLYGGFECESMFFKHVDGVSLAAISSARVWE